MILSRKEQRMLHMACIRKHLKAVGFEMKGFWRACKPDGLCCVAAAFFVAALLILVGLFLTGCSRNETAPVSSYRYVTVPEAAWRGDNTYADANPEWIEQFYSARFRPYINDSFPNWDAGFDCNKWVALFAAQAQVAYAYQSFHARNAPQSLAIGEAWVKRGNKTHALVFVITAQGERFFEPQTGKWVDAGGPVYFRKL